MSKRICPFMTGPSDPSVKISAAKWWLAISRDVFVTNARMQRRNRPPVTCRRTPTFSGPLR